MGLWERNKKGTGFITDGTGAFIILDLNIKGQNEKFLTREEVDPPKIGQNRD